MTIPSTSSPTGNKNASKLAGFDLIQTNYKTVGDHGIRADFLIPKTPFSGKKRPVIVRFHGGALVCILPDRHLSSHFHLVSAGMVQVRESTYQTITDSPYR